MQGKGGLKPEDLSVTFLLRRMMRAGGMPRSCKAPAMGDRGIACRMKLHSQSGHPRLPEAEQEQNRYPGSPAPPFYRQPRPFQPWTPSKTTTAFCSRRNKNTSTKATRHLWFDQNGGKKKTPQALHPASGRSCLFPCWEHCPWAGGRGGLPSNPVSHQSPGLRG